MIRRLLFTSLAFGTLLQGGCASLDNVIGGIGNAPEWFQQRRVEIRGEGYPSFSEVPVDTFGETTRKQLQLSEQQMQEIHRLLEAHPRAELPILTAEDVARLAEELREPVEKELPAAEPLLSDEEIQALFRSTQPDPTPTR